KSGSSVDTHGKISKRGSRYLRHAIYMIAEFARRHNPVLKAHFEKIKNGNKKRHKLAVTAIANKVARYVYSVLKTGTKFVISYEQLMLLNEETQTTFFTNISTEIPRNTRKQIYSYSDINGEIFDFIYTKYDE
ncbi:transposase, partial [Breznakia sp. PM6-1]